MRKPDFRLCENKDADQLGSICTADQRLCFRYTDSTISLLKSEISSFKPSSDRPVCVRPGRKPQRPFSHVAAHLILSMWCFDFLSVYIPLLKCPLRAGFVPCGGPKSLPVHHP